MFSVLGLLELLLDQAGLIGLLSVNTPISMRAKSKVSSPTGHLVVLGEESEVPPWKHHLVPG